jgi:hypothetical protein
LNNFPFLSIWSCNTIIKPSANDFTNNFVISLQSVNALAKSAGFDPKVVKMVIKLRQKEPAELQEEETLLDLYRRALGL